MVKKKAADYVKRESSGRVCRITYKSSPFKILDIITRRGCATVGELAKKLGLAASSPRYRHMVGTLTQLHEDGLLERTGKGYKGDPFDYYINRKNPGVDMLLAMCQPEEVLEAKCQPVKDYNYAPKRLKIASTQLDS